MFTFQMYPVKTIKRWAGPVVTGEWTRDDWTYEEIMSFVDWLNSRG